MYLAIVVCIVCTCEDQERKWSICTQRNLSQFTTCMFSPFICKLGSVVRKCCHFCRVVMSMIFVFSALMTILFSSHHFDILWRSLLSFTSTAWVVFPVAVIVESSAYMSTDALTFRGISFMNMMNNSGPNMDPWGTPVYYYVWTFCMHLYVQYCTHVWKCTNCDDIAYFKVLYYIVIC